MALDESLRTQPRTGLRRHWPLAIIGTVVIGVLAPWIVALVGGFTGDFTRAELWIGLVGIVATLALLMVRRTSRLLPYAVGLVILPVASFIGLEIAAIIATGNWGV